MRVVAALVAPLLAAVACQPPTSVLAPDQAPYVASSLSAEGPIEVAILPVSLSRGLPDDVASAVRSAAYDELLRKGFSPLSLAYVDQRLGPAEGLSVPGELPIEMLRGRLHADSFLSLRVLRVDLEEGGRRRISARATLLDGDRGEVIFEHSLVDRSPGPEPSAADLSALMVRVLTPLPGR